MKIKQYIINAVFGLSILFNIAYLWQFCKTTVYDSGYDAGTRDSTKRIVSELIKQYRTGKVEFVDEHGKVLVLIPKH